MTIRKSVLIFGYVVFGILYSIGYNEGTLKTNSSLTATLILAALWPIDLSITMGWYSAQIHNEHERNMQ